jgi:isopenicillin-N N-acyltransferase like protein
MRTEMNAFLPNYLAASMAENPAQVNLVALDQAWAELSPKLDPRLVDEISGIANGALIDVVTVRRAHMVPVVESGYTGHALSVWGPATSGGRVLSGHTLNWPLSRGAQNFPVVVVYVPEQGLPHANVTFAGFAFGPVGINVSGVSTIQVHRGGTGSNHGGDRQHFLPLSRELLHEAASLRQVLSLVQATPPVRVDEYLFADGRFEFRGAKAIMPLNQPPQFIFQNDPADEFQPSVQDGVVYAGPGANNSIFPYVQSHYGSLNDGGLGQSGNLQLLMQSLGTAENVLNVVVDNRDLELHVNYASGNVPASQRPFVTIPVQAIIPPGPPVGR